MSTDNISEATWEAERAKWSAALGEQGLLPCPFCGRGFIRNEHVYKGYPQVSYEHDGDEECPLRYRRLNYPSLVAGWNRRVVATRQPVEAAQRRPATEREIDEAMEVVQHQWRGHHITRTAWRACERFHGIAGQGEREGGD